MKNRLIATMSIFCVIAFLVLVLAIDLISPKIEFTSPTPSPNSIQSETFVYLNYTVEDTNVTSSFIDWNNSLVGWWRGENDSTDDSSYGNDGTLNGDTDYVYGNFGKAFSFDGSGDYINTASLLNDISTSTTGSICSWIKIDSDDDSLDRIFSITAPSGSRSEIQLIIDGRSGADRIYVIIIQDGTVKTIFHGASDEWDSNFGNWGFVCVTHNSTSMKVYLDGSLSEGGLYSSYTDETKWFKAILSDASNPATLSRVGSSDESGSKSYFKGSIDELMIFKRALGSEEIISLYNSTNTYHNFTNLDDGNYTYKAYAQDEFGNLDTTVRTYTFENTTISARDFVSYWDTTQTSDGSSASDSVTLPITGTYNVNWGDGTSNTSVASHTYSSEGAYRIVISNMSGTTFRFNNVGDRLKIF